MHKGHDKSKFSDFVNKEYQRLKGFVNKMIRDMPEVDSEDIIQDVMLNLFNKADIVLPIENIAGYIYQALKNKVIDIMRKRNIKRELSINTPVSIDENLTLVDILEDRRCNIINLLDRDEIKKELYDAIDNLNPDERAVLIATEFEGRRYKELSREWNIPVGTLLSKKSRVLKKIQSRLKNYIIFEED